MKDNRPRLQVIADLLKQACDLIGSEENDRQNIGPHTHTLGHRYDIQHELAVDYKMPSYLSEAIVKASLTDNY